MAENPLQHASQPMMGVSRPCVNTTPPPCHCRHVAEELDLFGKREVHQDPRAKRGFELKSGLAERGSILLLPSKATEAPEPRTGDAQHRNRICRAQRL